MCNLARARALSLSRDISSLFIYRCSSHNMKSKTHRTKRFTIDYNIKNVKRFDLQNCKCKGPILMSQESATYESQGQRLRKRTAQKKKWTASNSLSLCFPSPKLSMRTMFLRKAIPMDRTISTESLSSHITLCSIIHKLPYISSFSPKESFTCGVDICMYIYMIFLLANARRTREESVCVCVGSSAMSS